jgi:hypothetical protein
MVKLAAFFLGMVIAFQAFFKYHNYIRAIRHCFSEIDRTGIGKSGSSFGINNPSPPS